MTSLTPRAVLVTRPSELEELIAIHATRGQAEFFLNRRGQTLAELERRSERLTAAVDGVKRALPEDWVVAQVTRDDLDRFLFADRDIVIAVGQDGLVANLAKYLDGQPVVGVTPAEEASEGVLTATPVKGLPVLLRRVAAQDVTIEHRAMVEATLDDGQSLTALNELFIGHRSHQSARYTITADGRDEDQSSSGVVVSTGTGLTGWARSILTATRRQAAFSPEERRAIFFAREPWPSKATGCDLAFGEVAGDTKMAVTSRMNDGGVIFADGIEQDFLKFEWGIRADIRVSDRTLNLVHPD